MITPNRTWKDVRVSWVAGELNPLLSTVQTLGLGEFLVSEALANGVRVVSPGKCISQLEEELSEAHGFCVF